MEKYIEPLLSNSKNALFAAIEIHNKPLFPHRYQICTIALINAWELLLKAFIAKYNPEVKLIYEDGTSKQFEQCLENVKSALGNDFSVESESISNLYRYRCEYIHFYQDNIDTILYSLFSKSVELYNRFLQKYFGIDISQETNLILLPIGFKPPISPIDFLSNKSNLKDCSKEVNDFIEAVLTSTQSLYDSGVEETIFQTFNIALINENRISNADIVAAIAKEGEFEKIKIDKLLKAANITNDPAATHVKIDESSLFKDVYTDDHKTVVKNARNLFSDFIMNKKFNDIMKALKNNPALFRVRYLDVQQETGAGGKGYFSKGVYEELGKHFTPTPEEAEPSQGANII